MSSYDQAHNQYGNGLQKDIGTHGHDLLGNMNVIIYHNLFSEPNDLGLFHMQTTLTLAQNPQNISSFHGVQENEFGAIRKDE